MNFVFNMEHPAWVHQYKYLIRYLKNNGHNVIVFAIKKEMTIELLEEYNIEYKVVAKSTGKNLLSKSFILLKIIILMIFFLRKFKPDYFIGRATPTQAIVSWLFRKPHLAFADTEHSKISLTLSKIFKSNFITTVNFKKDLGENHIRLNTFKELAYLHPDKFVPNSDVLKEIGLNNGEDFYILRFVSWQADHDIGQKGLTDEGKRKLIDYLKDKGKIIITSESPLPKEFEEYRMSISPTKMHDLLYYASMYIGEGGTMASESAVLGTPSILVNTLNAGVFEELENKYGLLFRITDEKKVLEKVKDVLGIPKTHWLQNKEILLKDTFDVTEYIRKKIIN